MEYDSWIQQPVGCWKYTHLTWLLDVMYVLTAAYESQVHFLIVLVLFLSGNFISIIFYPGVGFTYLCILGQIQCWAWTKTD